MELTKRLTAICEILERLGTFLAKQGDVKCSLHISSLSLSVENLLKEFPDFQITSSQRDGLLGKYTSDTPRDIKPEIPDIKPVINKAGIIKQENAESEDEIMSQVIQASIQSAKADAAKRDVNLKPKSESIVIEDSDEERDLNAPISNAASGFGTLEFDDDSDSGDHAGDQTDDEPMPLRNSQKVNAPIANAAAGFDAVFFNWLQTSVRLCIVGSQHFLGKIGLILKLRDVKICSSFFLS